MKIGWIGFHVEGIPALRQVLQRGYHLEAVITLPTDLAAKRSGAADYSVVCREFGVPLQAVTSINADHTIRLLEQLSLDVAFVIGWTEMVGPRALPLARVGMIGAHASLLPRYRGRAPINWAVIRGLKQTGNTLFWLTNRVDGGHIIEQVTIPITPYDTCASLYERVAESNARMILKVLPRLLEGQRPGRPQRETDDLDLPARRPEDGLIDWSASHADTYNFIRGITRPYPGAFSFLDGQRWRIWHCARLPGCGPRAEEPGRVLGPMISPVASACGQVVACGTGAVVLLELENDRGEILQGSPLSEQSWAGKVLSRE